MYKNQNLTAHSRSLTPSPTHSFPASCPGQTWGKLPCALTFLFDWAIPLLSHLSLLERIPDPQLQLLPLPFLSALMCSLVRFHWNYSNQMLSKFPPSPSPLPHSIHSLPGTTLNFNFTVILIMDYGRWHNLDKILALVIGCMDAQDADSYLTLFHSLLCILCI